MSKPAMTAFALLRAAIRSDTARRSLRSPHRAAVSFGSNRARRRGFSRQSAEAIIRTMSGGRYRTIFLTFRRTKLVPVNIRPARERIARPDDARGVVVGQCGKALRPAFALDR